MGRPYKKELYLLDKTFRWANEIEIGLSYNYLEILQSFPTFVVGSGGSFSACHMLSILQQSRGSFSKPVTPLELYYAGESIRNSNVVFLSASGRNSDILFAYTTAIKQDARNILGICMRRNTKLFSLSLNHSISKILEFDLPVGKDGFLATNSLMGYFVILSRIFGYRLESLSIKNHDTLKEDIRKFTDKLDTNFTITVLYAGWGQPVAIDIESKFTEAGLGNILFSDFRNFGHGRHNWFDKKKRQSAIVALVTPEIRELSKKTLSLLPDDIPKLVLSSEYNSPMASIELLVQSFFVSEAIGENIGIDPGRPGVPAYGSKLYNLRYQSILNTNEEFRINNIILNKCGKTNVDELTTDELKFWKDSLKKFRNEINSTEFGCVVLDYDGTLSNSDERESLPSTEIINALNTFINKGFVIGIVTGRGKSIRETLQQCFDKRKWKSVIVGYYNGGIVSSLDDISQPDTSNLPGKSLKKLASLFDKLQFPVGKPAITLRPLQLTIEKNNVLNWPWTRDYIKEFIEKQKLSDIQFLESGHSLDIISRPAVSKLNIIKICIDICISKGLAGNVVCIGDKGKYPGNDYELLGTKYSLSVNEVSADPESCWNLSQLGQRGKLSCLYYLNSAKFTNSFFTMAL